MITIAIDAMGSDAAPRAQLMGADRLLQKDPDVRFIIVGDKAQMEPILSRLPVLRSHSEIIHTEDYISPDDKPSIALRQGKNSSMALAIKAVDEGQADAMISAGNTGALMAWAKLTLRMLPGIDHPAIVTTMPTVKGQCVMLDLGANVECTPEHLFQFAVMGDAYARAVLELTRPSIGLLNIGSEELKGHGYLKTAAELLKNTELPLHFHGFIEGDDITAGTVDVVVTDGFTGNIALKVMEGTAKTCKHFFIEALTSTLRAKIGALVAKPALKNMSKKIDPRRHNGAMFVGLNGIAVKSHGSADDTAFYNSLKVALNLARHKINDRIIREMQDAGGCGLSLS